MDMRRALARAGWRVASVAAGPQPRRQGEHAGAARAAARRDLRRPRQVLLVGWSLGGMFARELAHRHPDKVRAVVTLCSPFPATQDQHQRPRILRADRGPRRQRAAVPARHRQAAGADAGLLVAAGRDRRAERRARAATMRSTRRWRSTPIMSARCCGGRR